MFSISSVADEAPQLYHLTHLTPRLVCNYPYSPMALFQPSGEEKDLPNADRHYLNILVLVPKMLSDELNSLGCFVSFWRQEDVADSVTVSSLSDWRVIFE